MNQYDVIYLNMQRFLIRAKDHKVTEYLERAVIEELRDIYGDLFPERVTVLAEALEKIYVKTDKQFIFLIDEWDCVIRERQESEALQKQYLDFLRDLLKDQPYVALAENSLGCAVGLAYYSARNDYKLIREFPAGKGFADIVFLPLPHTDKPALVVELKYDRSACSAIRQILDRQYMQALEDYTGEILLVGINYDKNNKNKPHSCEIKKVIKQPE